MLLQVLGTAAGGGIPQWNCACPGCSGARAHPHWRRRHASLAVQAGEDHWYLVNATPDIGDQIEARPGLQPGPGLRQTPVAGLVLTDAELDHTLGIARLREADSLQVLATAPVRQALLDRLHLGAVLGPYTSVSWRELPPRGAEPLDGGGGGGGGGGGASAVQISAIPVSGKRPRYAADAPDDDAWVIALRLYEPASGASAVYAPALAAWPDRLQQAAAEADVVIVDGTFWDDEEPRRTGISTRTATGMGHLPIDGPGGTAELLAPLAARCLYTHLNNTNPLVDPAAPEHKRLARLGIEVAQDGMVIEL
ncbi:pyrroloquinoline quinone biosynthesis protein PqqB [Streptomyces sp. A3M-1-3]|uniref:pyrroloquinoline quinone biosynthesis protein PqqB n=1 Tax=Streptomyces sp. A3M-1-3 TaxID=2962044 RepID=UPI0020B76BA9|nr:pyrroloquinoline quinone biosynthesis protein PqqB [Streptomyces sp. A3M-1-3]MCP3820535.1 pyrroloquinoline quinone biosynthesis protein PqqB [Streptomyces sp. A3M-1-3]